MTLTTWLAFFVASWLISLSPGPGALSCMASGLKYGWRKGLWNIFGLQVGIMTLLTVLPQFIDPHAPQFMQYATCGGTLVFTDWVVMNGYTLFAAKLLRYLREPHHILWTNRTFGALFVAAGGLLATFKRGV